MPVTPVSRRNCFVTTLIADAANRVGSSTTFSVAESAPAIFTCATPAMARRSLPRVRSAISVSCDGVSVFDVSASETIGCVDGSNR